MSKESTSLDQRLRSLEMMQALLEDRLSGAELARAEELLQADPLYAMALESLHQEMLKEEAAVDRAAELEVELVATARQMAQAAPANRKRSLWPWYGLAAALIALLVLFLWPGDADPIRPETALAHYDARLSMRGTALDTVISEIQALYEERDYMAALELGNVFLRSGQDSLLSLASQSELRLLLANAALHQQEPEQAQQLLTNAFEFPEVRQQNQQQWHLALSYWIQGDFPQARQHFEWVAENGGSMMAEKASKILETL